MSTSVRSSSVQRRGQTTVRPTSVLALVVSWAFVGAPLAYGVYETAKKASALFTG